MRAFRPFIMCVAGVAAVGLLCVYLGAAESAAPAAKAPDLSQRVTTLEERVARLEKLLAERIMPDSPLVAPPSTPIPRNALPVPATPQMPPGMPKNAVPFEFNGGTYYIVPLAKEAARQ